MTDVPWNKDSEVDEKVASTKIYGRSSERERKEQIPLFFLSRRRRPSQHERGLTGRLAMRGYIGKGRLSSLLSLELSILPKSVPRPPRPSDSDGERAHSKTVTVTAEAAAAGGQNSETCSLPESFFSENNLKVFFSKKNEKT